MHKNKKQLKLQVFGKKGAALPLVLFFALSAFLTASIFMLTQLRIRRPSVRRKAELQALLNARSGVWLGLSMIDDKSAEPDSGLSDSSAIDAGFSNDAFSGTAENGEDSSIADETILSGQTVYAELYRDSLFGACSLSVQSQGSFLVLNSTGVMGVKNKKVEAKLGSQPLPPGDTVLYLETHGMPTGTGTIDGKAHFISLKIDSTKKQRAARFEIIESKKEFFLSHLSATMHGGLDTSFQEIPVNVSNLKDFMELPDVVNASVIINCTFGEVTSKVKRELVILGDLQFTGNPHIENADFRVGGEIQIYGNTTLRNVSLFSQSRIFIAGEAVLEGDAVALSDIEIFEAASIEGKSTIVSFGRTQKKDTTRSSYCIHIRDRAAVDAVVIGVHNARGIETGPATQITGVLWTQGPVRHNGSLAGVIRAKTLVSRDSKDAVKANICDGKVEQLDEIGAYALPYFIGRTAIIEWKEQT